MYHGATKSKAKTLWDEICIHYETGIRQVSAFQKIWENAKPFVDEARFTAVHNKLSSQAENALVWKDGCLLYFQRFSKKPFPTGVKPSVHNLDELIEKDKKPLRENNNKINFRISI